MTSNNMVAEEDLSKANILQVAIRRRLLIDEVKLILKDSMVKGESINPSTLYEKILKMEKKV
tara:strand:+ start:424 stop:609 length:186 start_codon:yes stop_codon:yes gene_type:complete